MGVDENGGRDRFLTFLLGTFYLQVSTGTGSHLFCLPHFTGAPQPGSSDLGISGLSRQSHGAVEWCLWRGYRTDKVWKRRRPHQKCHTRCIELCCQGKERKVKPTVTNLRSPTCPCDSVVAVRLQEVTHMACASFPPPYLPDPLTPWRQVHYAPCDMSSSCVHWHRLSLGFGCPLPGSLH